MDQELDIRVCNRYKLIQKIGEGGYGSVYQGFDTMQNRDIAIKLEHTSIVQSILESEYDMYKRLRSVQGIPQVYWCGQDCDYRALVFELLGPSLDDLFSFFGRKFSLKTVLMIADQLVARLQAIHSRGVIHRDIKPDNFLMGTGRRGNTIFVTDLGLAWSEAIAGVGRRGRGLMGTAIFASVNGHQGAEQCPFDDLESLGYLLVYLIRGSLPWERLKPTATKDKETRILDMKQCTRDEELLLNCPAELQLYFQHVRSHGEKSSPDYKYLRSLFSKAMKRLDYHYDNVYDWTLKLYKARSYIDLNKI